MKKKQSDLDRDKKLVKEWHDSLLEFKEHKTFAEFLLSHISKLEKENKKMVSTKQVNNIMAENKQYRKLIRENASISREKVLTAMDEIMEHGEYLTGVYALTELKQKLKAIEGIK